ncbi:MFS transporter [Floricoccus tropicus]|uniref:MFS transporter n=1 Tax=Floricoccus tropicus TaxID=1859473 RepID=UPI0009F3E69C|nr:MFS transporter [Floricoccus tropicus]
MTENNKISHLNGIDSWKRNFYILFTGQQLSTFTSMIVQYSLIWYLTDKSKSPTILAISTIMAFLPGIFISPFIGPLIDKINKKILLIASDWIVAFSAIILALIGQGGNLPFWMICLALFIRSLAGTVQTPTTQSIIPTLVPEDFVPKVGGLNGAFNSASMLVTPAIGAFFME